MAEMLAERGPGPDLKVGVDWFSDGTGTDAYGNIYEHGQVFTPDGTHVGRYLAADEYDTAHGAARGIPPVLTDSLREGCGAPQAAAQMTGSAASGPRVAPTPPSPQGGGDRLTAAEGAVDVLTFLRHNRSTRFLGRLGLLAGTVCLAYSSITGTPAWDMDNGVPADISFLWNRGEDIVHMGKTVGGWFS